MQALVIVAHESHLNPNSSAPTYDHMDTVREAGALDGVRTGFWKEELSIHGVPRTVETDEMYVVPPLTSEGYFVEQVIPWELHLDGWDAADWGPGGLPASHVTLTASDVPEKTTHYCGPVGTYAAMTEVLACWTETVIDDPNVGEGFGLAAVGHGAKRNENSVKAIEYHVDRIRETDRSDEVQALYTDEEPEVDDVTDYFDSKGVVVVPLFTADGFHTQEDIPEDMGLTDDYRTGYDVLVEVEGHRIWHVGVVGTEGLMADVVLERAVDTGADIENSLEVMHERTRKTPREAN